MTLNIEMFIKRNILYVRFDGELDQNNVQKLKERVVEVIERYNIKYLVLNFGKLSFIDSSGIGFIIGRYNNLKNQQGKIILCSLNEQIRRLILLSGLSKICMIKQNEEEVNEFLGVA